MHRSRFMVCGVDIFTAELLLASKSSPHLKLASVSVWARISATDESHARGKKKGVEVQSDSFERARVAHTHICERPRGRFKDNKPMIYTAAARL